MNNEMKDLSEVVQKVQTVEDGVTNLIIPILKDTIADNNKDKKRMFIAIVFLILALIIVSLHSQYLILKQNEKYAEFLSQFEFEGESTVFQTTDDYSTINSGINITNTK